VLLNCPALLPKKLLEVPVVKQRPALHPTKKLFPDVPEILGAQVLQERKLETQHPAIAPLAAVTHTGAAALPQEVST